MKRYYSAVSPFTKWVLISAVLLPWVAATPILTGKPDTLYFVIGMLLGIYTVFMASIYFNTYYRIEEDQLIWVTGPIKGKVGIHDIKQIKKAESAKEISAIVKPVLSQKPLLLRYSTYDDLPVSPREEPAFIAALLKVNPDITLLSDVSSASDPRVETSAS